MNGLAATTTTALSSWGEHKSLKSLVYEIIDSKIDSFEVKTRKLLNRFRRPQTTTGDFNFPSDENYELPSMSGIQIEGDQNEQIFRHLEDMSRSLYVLEQMKFSLSENNALEVISFLEGDKYLTIKDGDIQSLLNRNTQ
jgi:hypothetical protein